VVAKVDKLKEELNNALVDWDQLLVLQA